MAFASPRCYIDLMEAVKSIFALAVFIAILVGAYNVTSAEGWVSGLLFIVFAALFMGFVEGAGEVIERLLGFLFGD